MQNIAIQIPGRDIVKGLPDPINSAFHLTYNMVLNLLRLSLWEI